MMHQKITKIKPVVEFKEREIICEEFSSLFILVVVACVFIVVELSVAYILKFVVIDTVEVRIG